MSGDKPSAKIDYAILCDDIRQEKNGKLILIGIYSGDILLKEFPGKLNLALLLHGKADSDCTVALEIKYRCEFDDEKPYEVAARGDIQVSDLGAFNDLYIPVPVVPVEFRGAGNLSISCRIDSSKWRTLLRKNIKLFDS